MAQVEPDVDYEIVLNNVCCTVNLGCRLNLQKLAENTYNVEYRNSRVIIRLRKPKVTAYVWSKGKIMCVGAHNEEEARMGARRIARLIQKKGFDVKFGKIHVVNVLACCTLPFRIRVHNFAVHYPNVSYEPELCPAAGYRIQEMKAHLSIFATGNINILASSVANVYKAANFIYPLVKEFGRDLTPEDEKVRAEKRIQAQRRLLFK